MWQLHLAYSGNYYSFSVHSIHFSVLCESCIYSLAPGQLFKSRHTFSSSFRREQRLLASPQNPESLTTIWPGAHQHTLNADSFWVNKSPFHFHERETRRQLKRSVRFPLFFLETNHSSWEAWWCNRLKQSYNIHHPSLCLPSIKMSSTVTWPVARS